VNPSSLLHGDYWLGNILWKDEELIAIIDWEDAMLGDPLADLAISRLEILWALGYEAMESFTTQYQVIMSEMDYSNLAYWDLWAALRPIANFSDWAEDAATRKLWRERHQLFSTQALEAITTI
jgi:aminoglycoside phosphotransferase (APT) family kinase protein